MSNNLAVDRYGGIYVVSKHSLHRYRWDGAVRAHHYQPLPDRPLLTDCLLLVLPMVGGPPACLGLADWSCIRHAPHQVLEHDWSTAYSTSSSNATDPASSKATGGRLGAGELHTHIGWWQLTRPLIRPLVRQAEL